MKKASYLFIISVLLFFISVLSCQGRLRGTLSLSADTLKDEESVSYFKLYPTSNMYNFIRLNTSNGTMDMIQWSIEDGSEFSYYLNTTPLSDHPKVGRFELYKTENIYTFLLLDKITGECWHVQWGFEKGQRFVQKIN